MDISKAKKVNELFNKLSKLENKINILNDFIKDIGIYERGDLRYLKEDGRIDVINFNEAYEVKEIYDLLFEYYNNEKDKILAMIKAI